MTRKRKRVLVYCIVGVILLGVGLFWLCYLSEAAFLKEAAYDVEIPESPELHANLYSLDGQHCLLVVYVPGTLTRKGFIVDMPAKKVGIPNFTTYTRVGKFALVDKMTLLGYPEIHGELVAAFEKSGDNWLIRVTGYAFDPEFHDSDTRSYLEEQLIYNKTVVLKPRST